MFLKKQNFKKCRSIAIFRHFAKGIVGQIGYKMVDFGNEVLINELGDWTATSKWREHFHVFTWSFAITCIPTNMVRTRGNLRTRKQNTKTTVPVDVVRERRTERFPPRFRPVGRFCELRFRYLSSPTGREGEKDKSSFIQSARLFDSTNSYIYITVSTIFPPCGTLRCVLM